MRFAPGSGSSYFLQYLIYVVGYIFVRLVFFLVDSLEDTGNNLANTDKVKMGTNLNASVYGSVVNIG